MVWNFFFILGIFSVLAVSANAREDKTKCTKNKWQCRDASCIDADGVCDGSVDCADGSDETHALCRNMQCHNNWFRCTYGACVVGTAPCNGIQECADDSDELLPRCRGEKDKIRDQFICDNGDVISATEYCDGIADCSDGSDETLSSCAAQTCLSYLFQCAYGACVDHGSDCNGKIDCADGSDESDELCNRTSAVSDYNYTIITTTTSTNRPTHQGSKCLLPPYPEYGSYTVRGVAGLPGQSYPSAYLIVTCNPGFVVDKKNFSICSDGDWSDPIPKCVRFCRLSKHVSVEYRCPIPGSDEGSRECGPFERNGTIATPVCRRPNYYSQGILSPMNCVDGSWDSVATCKPECGTITPEALQLMVGGWSAKRGELPWHAGIYDKTMIPYMQICGGSLISTSIIISAAHCFWSDVYKLLPKTNYAVAVGKRYRPWNEDHDIDAQQSDVADIKIPPSFHGSATNFQDDIAIVIVATPFELKPFIRPVCIDFDDDFDAQQLNYHNLGKVAGWGLTANGNPSQVLKVVELPFVDTTECTKEVPEDFLADITSDKICAGYNNGTSLCQGDSGGGLAFPSTERGMKRYYLRGIVSTSPKPKAGEHCNTDSVIAFTRVVYHHKFIEKYYNQIK